MITKEVTVQVQLVRVLSPEVTRQRLVQALYELYPMAQIAISTNTNKNTCLVILVRDRRLQLVASIEDEYFWWVPPTFVLPLVRYFKGQLGCMSRTRIGNHTVTINTK